MSQGGWVRALAPAKVNPWLEVLGKRDDGYHELDTLMLALDFGDEVRVRACERPGVHLRVYGEMHSADVPTDARNLAFRAAAVVLDEAGCGGGLELELEKRVPSRAGLGGGSADAAAAVLVAGAALGTDLGEAWRRARLSELGSDCVFFHDAALTGFARCTGRGEVVRPLPLPRTSWCVVVVAPRIACPTSLVYGALELSLSRESPPPSLPEHLFEMSEAELRHGLFNRLEGAALRAVPELAAWRALFDSEGCEHMRLSGSGSSFFGVYADPDEARYALDATLRAADGQGLAYRGAWRSNPGGSGAALLKGGNSPLRSKKFGPP